MNATMAVGRPVLAGSVWTDQHGDLRRACSRCGINFLVRNRPQGADLCYDCTEFLEDKPFTCKNGHDISDPASVYTQMVRGHLRETRRRCKNEANRAARARKKDAA